MSVRVDITYEGSLKCKAVHEPSRDVLATDAPRDNQGEGKHFSPTDLLATALGACILTTIGIAARGRGVNMDGASAEVHKEMGTTPRRHVSKLTVHVTLPVAVPEDKRAALEHIGRTCPVASSLAAATEIDLTYHYV